MNELAKRNSKKIENQMKMKMIKRKINKNKNIRGKLKNTGKKMKDALPSTITSRKKQVSTAAHNKKNYG